MKKTIFSCLVLAGLCSVPFIASAQGDPPPTTVTVFNAKGNPNANAVAFLSSAPLYRTADENGVVSFRPMPSDTLFLIVGKYIGMIPITNEKHLDVCFDKSELYLKNDPQTRFRTSSTPKFKATKLYTNPGIESYGNVSTLIKVKFPSINVRHVYGRKYAFLSTPISNLSASNITSSNSSGGTNKGSLVTALMDPNDIGAAYILVDGKLYQSLSEVDRDVKLNRLVSITYEKPDPMFGKGGNGKVLITTLDGEF